MTKKMGALKREDDRDTPSTAAKAFMVASLLVTLALFGYLTYEAVTAQAQARPFAEIVDRVEQPDGTELVEVRLTNPGGVGLRLATVELDCGSPPPSITLENIPAESYREAHLVCPAGTDATRASVANWFEA